MALWTQAEVDALKSAIASGVRSVTHDGKTVTYGSVSDMLKALRLMQQDVSPTTAPTIRRVEFRGTGGGST